MRFAHPRTVSEALRLLHDQPDASIIAGGTDFMVEVNSGHRRPTAIVSLRRVADLDWCQRTADEVILYGGLTYDHIERDAMLAHELPMLVQAARSVGSRQIRNAGTLGGNIGTASPAGDTLPVLAALDATVVVSSQTGTRTVPLREIIVGPKRTSLAPGDVIVAVHVPRTTGRQQFLKVGRRGAMTIAVVSCAVALDDDRRQVRCGLGAVGPVPIRPSEAEAFIAAEIDWDRRSASAAAIDRFGELAAMAAHPITDQRATAEYRRHAAAVIARRALERTLSNG